jgi:SynChlorMet cassette radical SAM/SPASM protein ScmE
MDDLDAIARLLLDELQLPSFWTNAASFMGLCMQNARDIQLSVEERSRVMETLYRLSKEYDGRIKATAGPLRDAIRWLRMDRQRKEGLTPSSRAGFLADCGKVMTEMGVRADGVMVPCLLMGHIELGRINRDSLATVWRDHPELNRMRRRRGIALADLEFCDGCEYVRYCGGNCPAIAFNRLGRDDLPNPDDCLKRFLEAGGRLPRA